MAVRQNWPNPSQASRQTASGHNSDLERALIVTDQRLTTIEKATSHLAANPTQQGPAVSVPPSSQLKVTPTSIGFHVELTLPHLISPAAGTSRNQTIAPIYHEVSYASSSDFSANPVTLKPGTQTFYPILENPGTTLYFRVRSSFDGKTWGNYVRSGPVSA